MLAARVDITAKDLPAPSRSCGRPSSVEPSNMRAYDLLGRIYIDQRKLPEARQEFQMIVDKQPKAVGPNTIIGMLYHTENQVAEAEKAYRRALDGDPSAPVAANNLAYIYAERGENLDEALRPGEGRGRPAAGRTAGHRHGRLGLLQEAARGAGDPAVPAVRRQGSAEPDSTCSTSGWPRRRPGDAPKARAALEQALKINPAFAGR